MNLHAKEKKKGGHTNPDVRTIIIIYNMKNRRCTIHVGLASLAQLYISTYMHARGNTMCVYAYSTSLVNYVCVCSG